MKSSVSIFGRELQVSNLVSQSPRNRLGVVADSRFDRRRSSPGFVWLVCRIATRAEAQVRYPHRVSCSIRSFVSLPIVALAIHSCRDRNMGCVVARAETALAAVRLGFGGASSRIGSHRRGRGAPILRSSSEARRSDDSTCGRAARRQFEGPLGIGPRVPAAAMSGAQRQLRRCVSESAIRRVCVNGHVRVPVGGHQ